MNVELGKLAAFRVAECALHRRASTPAEGKLSPDEDVMADVFGNSGVCVLLAARHTNRNRRSCYAEAHRPRALGCAQS